MESLPVFIGITVVLFGFAAYMTGQALAANWHHPGWAVFYILLLGWADRFIVWSLFDGTLFSLVGYAVDTATLLIIGLLGFRITQVRKMVQQYPWIYERSSLLSWRRIDDDPVA
ncbi:MAG: hypothetical protein MJE12_17020 [Alphaproteobacteria bacterium]|nr:hypothetical protein [Alphaproteobacteria bacterium]